MVDVNAMTQALVEDDLLHQCPSCRNMTYSLTGRCFDHNAEIDEQLVALELDTSSPCALTLATLNPYSPLLERLERLQADLHSRYAEVRRLQAGDKLFLRHHTRRANIKQLIDSFDQALRLTARIFIRRALEEVKEAQHCRNMFHPRIAANVNDVVAAISPLALTPFIQGTLHNWIEQETARRQRLAEQPITYRKLSGDDYRLDLGVPDATSFLKYRLAPGATTGMTLLLKVAPELQGLGVATRLYLAMANAHPHVETWRYANLKDAGHRFREAMKDVDEKRFPYPNPDPLAT